MNIPEGTPLVYVSFSAEIKVDTTETLIATMASLVNLKVKEVYLLLSTPGGTVMNGMNLYSVLRGLPFELSIHNVGNVDSIGNAVEFFLSLYSQQIHLLLALHYLCQHFCELSLLSSL